MGTAAMLKLLLLCALLRGSAAGQCTNDPGVVSVCDHCRQSRDCAGGTSRLCVNDQVCVEETDIITGVTTAQCETPPASYSACACDNIKCDPYDESFHWMCSGANNYIGPIPCLGAQTCSPAQGQCTDGPPSGGPCDGNQGQLVSIDEACKAYGFCSDPGGVPIPVSSCDAGKYFDVKKQNCMAIPQSCDGCSGICANPFDCSLIDYCSGNKLDDTFSCGPGNPYFNERNRMCGSEVSKCLPSTQCNFEAASNPANPANPPVTPPPSSSCTASTAYRMWPDPKSCKKYYRCLPTASNSYKMVRGKCPNKLMFNPDTNLCDLKENVTCLV